MKKIRQTVCAVLVFLLSVGFMPAARFAVTADAISSSPVRERLEAFKASYPAGSRWTAEFHGSNQCKGFARMAVYHIFGQTGSGAYRQWSYSGENNVGMVPLGSVRSFTAENVRALLARAAIGDILQFDKPWKHSMIVCGLDSDDCVVHFSKKSFGSWYGKNSAKLTLLRADNYDVGPTYSLGDVNTDGKVNSADARLALRAAAGIGTLTGTQTFLADVNADGEVKSADARLIIRIAARLEPTPEKMIPAA